jgi:two-component system response regulator FixJ
LLDIPVPEQGGLQALVELKEGVGSPPPIIVISGSGNTEVACRAGMLGATDFIERPFADGDLIGRVNKATADQSRQREFDIGLNSFYGSASLTKRQRQIFDQMLLGKSTKDIAFLLKLSPRTIEDHRANILDKANVRSTVQMWAAIWEAGRKQATGHSR